MSNVIDDSPKVVQAVVYTVCVSHKLDAGIECGDLEPGDERRIRASLLRRMANELEQLADYLPAGKLRFHQSDIDPAIHLIAEVRPAGGER